MCIDGCYSLQLQEKVGDDRGNVNKPMVIRRNLSRNFFALQGSKPVLTYLIAPFSQPLAHLGSRYIVAHYYTLAGPQQGVINSEEGTIFTMGTHYQRVIF